MHLNAAFFVNVWFAGVMVGAGFGSLVWLRALRLALLFFAVALVCAFLVVIHL